MSLFKTQSLFSIIAQTDYSDLASASVTRILYKKPNETTGYWAATVSGNDLVYNVSSGDIDQKGVWEFQAYIEVGGLKGFGGIGSKNFDQPLL